MMILTKISISISIVLAFGTVVLSQMRHDAHFVMGYWSDGGKTNNTCSLLQFSDIPTVDSKNEWVVDFKNEITYFGEIRVYTFTQTDTLINGRLYKEMIYHTISEPSTYVYTSEFYRQEGHKVFFQHDADEILLADFALSVGDTLYMNNFAFGGAPLVIAARDTIVMNDGKERIQLKYYCVDENEPNIPSASTWWTMIEGLGTFENMFGQLSSCSLNDPFYFRYIRCYYEDGRLVYKDDEIDDCFLSTTSNLVLYPITIYPNPAYDVLNIPIKDESANQNLLATVMNIDGKVMSESVINADNFSIDISALPSGIYTVKVKDNNQILFVTKFIKIQ
jgi:hypothetical protein